MNRPLRFLVAAATILGASVPRVALADPVTITSGFIFLPASTVFSPIQLEGTDGVLPFSFTGAISPDSNIAVRFCTPCSQTATSISVEINTTGMDLPGIVLYGDDNYGVGGLADTVGSVALHLDGSALLPPAPSITNQLATVTAPFEVVPTSRFSPPISGGPFGPGNTLRGSGTATVSLFAEEPRTGLLVWSLQSADTTSPTRRRSRNRRRSCCWCQGWRDWRCSAAGGGRQLTRCGEASRSAGVPTIQAPAEPSGRLQPRVPTSIPPSCTRLRAPQFVILSSSQRNGNKR